MAAKAISPWPPTGGSRGAVRVKWCRSPLPACRCSTQACLRMRRRVPSRCTFYGTGHLPRAGFTACGSTAVGCMLARRRLSPKPRPCSSAKVPDPLTVGPRLYTIPPTAPFLTTLARALIAGELPLPGGPKPGPLVLPLTTLYLPTRRAARALREAFLSEAGGESMLLPRIRALGDPDEEASIIFGADDAEGGRLDGAAGAPAIDKLPRRLALMRLIIAWSRKLLSEDPVSYTHLRAHETKANLVCRLLLE